MPRAAPFIPYQVNEQGNSAHHSIDSVVSPSERPAHPTSPPAVTLERRRAQSRLRQIRYLQKKRRYEEDLKVSVQTMQSEIRSLQLNLQEFVSDKPQLFTNTPAEGLLPPVPITPSPDFVQISQNLVRCFRSGFSTSDHWPWVPCSEEGQEQINFVQRTLHPEVLVGDLHGPNAFLEQWRHFTAFFGSLSLHGHSFELLNHSAGLAVCRAQLTLSLRLIDETLQHVLPHLLHPQHSELKERLLGKQIHVAMTMLLQFDPLGRVCSYDSLLDLVTAFRPLVSSYEDVEIVLSGARISSYGSISQAVGTATAKPDGRLALAFVLSPMDDE